MPYTHYGEIGDVWKHLPLAEVLSIEKPLQYWESHAASGLYGLEPNLNQEYGAIRYIEEATSSDVLTKSPYTELLDGYRAPDGRLVQYPGSPMIAFHFLEDIHSTSDDLPSYLFCDIEESALASVRRGARRADVPDSRVETVHGDGVTTLFETLLTSTPDRLERTFAHIDPYSPMEPGDDGRSGWDLFRELVEAGVKALLWYGYQTDEEAAAKDAFFTEEIGSAGFPADEHDLWIAEVVVNAFDDPDSSASHPGVFGSGVVCGNLSSEAIDRCRDVGHGLVSIYEDAVLPGGGDGSLRLVEPRF